MAASLDDPEFYLPTHFLTDDVVLHNTMEIGTGFPTEFPYEFDSSPSNSALSSPVESEGSSSDEDDFLAGLTRRLAQSSIQQIVNHTSQTQKLSVPTFSKEKPEWVMSGSPQSTLSGIGSWSSNGSPTAPSPPTTPYGAQNDTWDLIYAAAGQVARLKMTNSSGCEGPTKFTSHNPGLLGPPRRPSPPQPPCLKIPPAGICHNQNFTQFHHVNKPQCSSRAWGNQNQVKLPWSAAAHQQQQQIQNIGGNNIVGYENSPCVNLPQSAWPPLQAQHQQRNSCTAGRPSLSNGAHVKRESTGTGVFLPRRYSPASEPPRRRQGCQTVLLPAKVVQALNLNFEGLNGQAPPRFTTGLTPDQETLLARRNALLTQQRRNALRPEGPLNCEVRLPQEWTY